MDFIDLLKNYWEVIAGFFLLTLWVGSDHNKINKVEENQKLHSKEHEDSSFISEQACTGKMAQCTKVNNIQFAHGTEQFARFEAIITAKEVKDENRHSEVMRILLEMNK